MALVNQNKLSINENKQFDNFHFFKDTAFHFDATKFGLWLRDHYCKPRGVKHILEDVKELCSHVIVLRDGKLVLDESIEGLIENEDIYIIKSNNTKIALDKLKSHSDVKVVDSNDKKITVKSAINIYDLISIIPSESQLNSISKDPNISRLFK